MNLKNCCHCQHVPTMKPNTAQVTIRKVHLSGQMLRITMRPQMQNDWDFKEIILGYHCMYTNG